MRNFLGFVLVLCAAAVLSIIFLGDATRLREGHIHSSDIPRFLRGILFSIVVALILHGLAARLTRARWALCVPYFLVLGVSVLALLTGSPAYVAPGAVSAVMALLMWKLSAKTDTQGKAARVGDAT